MVNCSYLKYIMLHLSIFSYKFKILTFSIASREVLLIPLPKYFALVWAQSVLGAAVIAARFCSPSAGVSPESIICWIILQIDILVYIMNQLTYDMPLERQYLNILIYNCNYSTDIFQSHYGNNSFWFSKALT